jgi:hypothetical protein
MVEENWFEDMRGDRWKEPMSTVAAWGLALGYKTVYM